MRQLLRKPGPSVALAAAALLVTLLSVPPLAAQSQAPAPPASTFDAAAPSWSLLTCSTTRGKQSRGKAGKGGRHRGEAAGNAAGGAPTPAAIEQKIREENEKPAPPGSDGAVTVTMQGIQIGKPHPWDPQADMGRGGGGPGTTVWPVKTHYTLRTHYRTRTEAHEYRFLYECYKNSFGDWVLVGNGTWGPPSRWWNEPSTMK